MEKLIRAATDETPAVTLDAENNVFEFSGMSMPEETAVFYKPILDWWDAYLLNPNSSTKMVFKMEYFNTNSSKNIFDVLMKLKKIHTSGKEVVVSWCSHVDNDEMEDAGKDLAEMLEIPFEFSKYSD